MFLALEWKTEDFVEVCNDWAHKPATTWLTNQDSQFLTVLPRITGKKLGKI